QRVGPKDLRDIQQTLHLWTGEIESRFSVEDIPVTVRTVCHQEGDVIGIRIKSDLMKNGQLKVRLRIPFPTGGWTDLGTKWEGKENYISELSSTQKGQALITRKLDSLTYQIGLGWKGNAAIDKVKDHYFTLTPETTSEFQFSCNFTDKKVGSIPSFSDVEKS